MQATESPAVTVADFLDEASARLDALCDQPMTDVEFALWRVAAQHNAAVRLLAADTHPNPCSP